MRHVFSLSLVLCTAASLLAAAPVTPARAETPTASSTGNEESYRRLIDQAVSEFKHGNFPEAFSLFERAHGLQPSARTLRGMGLAKFEARNYVEAIQHLKSALRDERKPLTDQQRTHTQDLIQRSEGYIAQYELQLSPDGATVLVDARPPVIVDGTLLLDPGAHELTISVDGYEVETRNVRAQPNERLSLRIELDRTATAPGAEAEEEPASQGKGAREGLGRLRVSGLVVGGVGVASLATSLGLTLKARNLRDASGCEGNRCPDGGFAEYNRGVGFARASTAALVLGGAALATGITLLVWPQGGGEDESPASEPAGASARLTPAISPWFSGVTLSGVWR